MFEKEVTTELIGKYLKKFGWEKFQELPEAGEKQGLVVTGWSMGGDDHSMFIDPMLEKGSLLFIVRAVAKAPPDSTAADRLNGLLLAMSALNYKLIIGTWAFDPSDGEVVLKVGVPIKGGTLEYESFAHVLMALVSAVEVQGKGLREIVEGTKTAQQVIASF